MKKTNYSGFGGWIRYIRDYKSNIENLEIIENESVEADRQNRRISKKLNNEMLDKKRLEAEKDNLIALREQHIDNLSESLKQAKVEDARKQNIINILNAQLDDAEKAITDKNLTIKKLNMRYAQSQHKVQKLEKDIQKKDHKINFLKSSKDAPSKEKVLAYEKCMKEVEKRQKEKAK